VPRQKSNHVDSADALAARLRAARERAGISQRALARGICTPAYVSRLEKGERIPSLQLLRQLADRLDADADELASGVPGSAEDPLLAAELAFRLGETEHAELLFHEALDRGNRGLRSRALAGLGQVAFANGEHRRAIELLEQAVASRSASSGDNAATTDTLGRAYAMAGELESAVAVFERALESAADRDDTLEIVRFSVLLANALIDLGNYGRAAELLGDALARTADSSDPILRARLWWSQSRLHDAQGDSQTAARYARRALDTLETTEHTVYAARAHQLLAHVELDRGRAEQALELLERGYPLIEASGNRFEQAVFRLEQARALAQLERREEAAATAMEASALLAGVSPGDAGRAYMLIGEVFEQLGDNARARELYELAIEQIPAANHHRREAYSRLAGVLEAEGLTEEALDVLKHAVRSEQPERHR